MKLTLDLTLVAEGLVSSEKSTDITDQSKETQHGLKKKDKVTLKHKPMSMKGLFLSRNKERDINASKSLEKLNLQVKKIDLVRLRAVLPKKVKEYNEQLKIKKAEQFDSSDLTNQLKYLHI